MKKGQVTLFIIVGILAVVAIIAVYLLMGRDGNVDYSGIESPRDSIRVCVEDLVKDSTEKIIYNGGQVNPTKSIMYMGESWNYLCYVEDRYANCENLHPMLELEVEREIERDTIAGVQNCFNSMREEYEDRGYTVKGGATQYSVDLVSGHVKINLEKDIKISSETGNIELKEFGTGITSSAYKLIQIARRISNDESVYCDFPYGDYMLLYPDYKITRTDYRDSKIYSLTDQLSGETMRFAIRSCGYE